MLELTLSASPVPTRRVILGVTMATWLASAMPVSAQPTPPAPEEATAPSSTTPDAPYNSPQRGMCTDEIRKDVAWRAALRDQIRPYIHEEDAEVMKLNRRHVFLAYGVLWILTALFLLFVWRRQARMKTDLADLEAQIRAELDKAS